MAIHESFSKRLSRRRASFFLAVILLLIGCDTQAQLLEQASRSYKEHRDYASLEVISRHLRKGMERTEVEELMGEADYSPIEGQYYYSSDRRETKSREKKQINMPVGLVVDYRNGKGVLTDKLQGFHLRTIGE